jgi:hypothetical protein
MKEVNVSHPSPTLAAAGKCKNQATATRVIRTRQPPGFKEQNDPVPGSQPDRERRQRLVQRASKPPRGLAARSTRFATRPRKHPARFSFSIPHARRGGHERNEGQKAACEPLPPVSAVKFLDFGGRSTPSQEKRGCVG